MRLMSLLLILCTTIHAFTVQVAFPDSSNKIVYRTISEGSNHISYPKALKNVCPKFDSIGFRVITGTGDALYCNHGDDNYRFFADHIRSNPDTFNFSLPVINSKEHSYYFHTSKLSDYKYKEMYFDLQISGEGWDEINSPWYVAQKHDPTYVNLCSLDLYSTYKQITKPAIPIVGYLSDSVSLFVDDTFYTTMATSRFTPDSIPVPFIDTLVHKISVCDYSDGELRDSCSFLVRNIPLATVNTLFDGWYETERGDSLQMHITGTSNFAIKRREQPQWVIMDHLYDSNNYGIANLVIYDHSSTIKNISIRSATMDEDDEYSKRYLPYNCTYPGLAWHTSITYHAGAYARNNRHWGDTIVDTIVFDIERQDGSSYEERIITEGLIFFVSTIGEVTSGKANTFNIVQTEKDFVVRNPNTGKRLSVILYNTRGQIVKSLQTVGDKIHIPKSGLASGSYILTINKQKSLLLHW